MSYEELIDWLFEKATLHPQLGFAGKNKRAWLWLPGNKLPEHERIVGIMQSAPLRGCTQLAYESLFHPAGNQMCEICWIGLDIDADDNPGIDLTDATWTGCSASMIRTSCSGKGIHWLIRLEKPILCQSSAANRIIKQLTQAWADTLALKICKRDRRMFWLFGGDNRILFQSEYQLQVGELNLAASKPETTGRSELEPTQLIQEWAGKLGLKTIRKSNPIYVGHVVELLRDLGEKVETQSSCTGNGQVNGYLDIAEASISLFSYADGHSIWSFEDVEAILNEN
jgi:hypothetical protein